MEDHTYAWGVFGKAEVAMLGSSWWSVWYKEVKLDFGDTVYPRLRGVWIERPPEAVAVGSRLVIVREENTELRGGWN